MKKQLQEFAYFLFWVVIGFLSCKKELNISDNIPPVANAGIDQTVILPKDSVVLDATASKDPDGTISTYQWIKIVGPESFIIMNAGSSVTSVRSLEQGVYQFELKVTDNKGSFAKDTVQITVNNGNGTNQPPVANAGADQTITLPVDFCTLNGSSSHDPDGSIESYQWTKIGGPSSYTIHDPKAAKTEVNSLSNGIYSFVLKVTDNHGAKANDTVQVTVFLPNASACIISVRPFINASLTQIGTMSHARFPYAGAAGSKIVFAGGGYYTNPGWFWVSPSVDIYDVNTQVWTRAQLSQERDGIAVTGSGNKIFFAGGGCFGYLFGNGLLDLAYSNVDIYDASTKTWSVTQLSEARTYLCASAAGNKVVFAGGIGNDYLVSNKVDIYDLSTDSWSVATLSEPRVGVNAVAVGDKIYIAGGYKEYDRPSSKVDIYNTTTNSWSTSSLLELSGGVSGVVKGNQILWAGQVKNPNSGKVEIWNTENGSISTHCLSYSRYAPVAVVKDNEVAFFTDNAWWDDYALASNRFDIYNVQTNQWSIGILPLSIASPAIINVNNTVYVGGGKTSTYNCTDKVYVVNW